MRTATPRRFPELDRNALAIKPLAERPNKLEIAKIHVPPAAAPGPLTDDAAAAVEETAARIRAARGNNRPVMLAFGAHTIKNGLAPVLAHLMEGGWATHLATNGAGIIHDWEFAYQGASSEDVRKHVAAGEFGLWEETGRYLNLALLVGAREGRGYGESVGAMIHRGGLDIPEADGLAASVKRDIDSAPALAAAAADLLARIREFELPPGFMPVPHPFAAYSAQAAAFRLGIPFTGHPMFGHDIIYTHPMNHGAAVGRTAERDFLRFAAAVQAIDGGVYLSIGSAVMSPMVFEKSLSMARNLEQQAGRKITDHFIMVVDLAESTWNWQADGEPPMDNPAYYLRYCKTFSRMGGAMRYASADNRDFLLALCRALG